VTDAYISGMATQAGISQNSGTTGNAVFDNYFQKILLEKLREKNTDNSEAISDTQVQESSADMTASDSSAYSVLGLTGGVDALSAGLLGINASDDLSSEIAGTEAGAPAASEINSGDASLEDIFQRASAAYGVSTQLLKAVAQHESGFNASAVSSAGAMGIMQLMPGTAAAMGVENPFDAEQNIMGGAKLLSRLLNEYQGDISLALAAYSAGEGNVAKYGGIPPFAETQNYVRDIMAVLNQSDSAGSTTQQSVSQAGDSTLPTATSDNSDTSALQESTLSDLVQLMRIKTLTDSTPSIGEL